MHVCLAGACRLTTLAGLSRISSSSAPIHRPMTNDSCSATTTKALTHSLCSHSGKTDFAIYVAFYVSCAEMVKSEPDQRIFAVLNRFQFHVMSDGYLVHLPHAKSKVAARRQLKQYVVQPPLILLALIVM